MGRDRLLTVRMVEKLLFEGRKIVLMGQNVLQLDNWIQKHPGGQLVILHMLGRDATNEITVYHSTQTLETMARYRIGTLVGPWRNKVPPIRGGDFRDPDSEASIPDTIPPHPDSLLCNSVDDQDHHQSPPQGRDEVIASYVKKAVDKDLDDYPAPDFQTQQDIEARFKLLRKRVEDGGFYECSYGEYAKELARYLMLFGLFATALVWKWYLTSAILLGLFWHQIMFTAHDAGHQGITHNFVLDSLIGVFIGNLCCGLSVGWWKTSHNVHHLITNHPTHDPDIQNVPLFATCPSFFKSIHSSYYDFSFVWGKFADLAVRYQKYTYYPVMGLARFNLYILSIHHLVLGPRPPPATAWVRRVEILSIFTYWFLFGYCLVWLTLPTWPIRIAFVLLSHIITMPLHVQITLSHWGMSTADLGEDESFPQRQLRTTMDVECSPWLDFVHGGLQFQAVHHLFPRVPRHNLRRLQVLVRQFCHETNIKYSILDFADGNKKVLGRLDEITVQLEMLLKCQQYMAETGESGLH